MKMPQNRCPAEVWAAIRKATALLDKERIRYGLIGTAALAAFGYDVPVPDADLFVESEPSALPSELFVSGAETMAASGALSIEVDGVRIDYVDADQPRLEPFWDTLKTRQIDGVWVAVPADAIAIKKSANRPKDIDFLKRMGLA